MREPRPPWPRPTRRGRRDRCARRRSRCTAASATRGSAWRTSTCAAGSFRRSCSAATGSSWRCWRDRGGGPRMDFHDSPDEAAFRERIRSWLDDQGGSIRRSHSDDGYWTSLGDWHQRLYDAGFFALAWPARYGGRELPPVYEVIVDEELARAGAPPKPSLGYLIQGLSRHGSEAIKERFLPGIINGRD